MAYDPASASSTSEAPQIFDDGHGVYSFNGEKLTERVRPVITIKDASDKDKVYKLVLRTARGIKESQWQLSGKKVEISAINEDLTKIYNDTPLDDTTASGAISLKIRSTTTPIPLLRQPQPPMVIQKPDKAGYYVTFDDKIGHGKRIDFKAEEPSSRNVGTVITVDKVDGTKTREYSCTLETSDASSCTIWKPTIKDHVKKTTKRSSKSMEIDTLNGLLGGFYARPDLYTITILQNSHTKAFDLFRPSSSSSAYSGDYNYLDYRSLFDDPARPMDYYENELQLANVHSNAHYEDSEYYNGLLLGGVIGGGSIMMILIVFCIGLAFGMVICFGYQKKKELEERKDIDLGQND
eukprot:988667_1